MYPESKKSHELYDTLSVTHSFSAAMLFSKNVISVFVKDHAFELPIGIFFLKVLTFLSAAVFNADSRELH